MNRAHLVLMLTGALGSALAACGDNSKLCGPNTTDVDGVCTADPPNPPVMCTDGTIKDPATGNCVLDPNACQDGTVKVGNACVDAGVVSADLIEAMEPNGLNLNFGEDSETPAGVIALKPVGQTFVIKGTITPFQDTDKDGQMDPDIDTYVLAVTAPTLLKISADGVHGLAAGFVSVAGAVAPDPLASWVRFGVNLSGDTSQRQLFLPGAGTYVIGIADTRSLFLAGGAAGPAPGALPFDYYVSITAENITTTALTVDANGAAQSVGELAPGETKLFAVPLGTGMNTVLYDIAAEQAVASVVANNTSGGVTKVKLVADKELVTDPAQGSVIGIRTGDTQIVAADTVFNYALGNVDYALTIQTGGSGELSKVGAGVTQPASTLAVINDPNVFVEDRTRDNAAVFSYDVVTNGEVTGMDLTWSVPVSGTVVDENGVLFAKFTYDPTLGFFFDDAWTTYRGLIRHATAGRYYFIVYDPAATATDITATSTYTPVTVTAVTAGTPITGQAVNAFGSNPFSYDAGTSQWEAFTIGAGGGTTTGNIAAAYIPLDTSFGRIDPLASTCTVGATDFCRDVTPLFTHTHTQAGTTVGRVLLNDTIKKYFVSVRPVTIANAQVNVDYRARDFVDLGTIVAGTPANQTAQVLSATTTVQRYLLKTNIGNGLTVRLTPTAGLNTRFQQLNLDETNRGAAVSNGGVGAVDIAQFFQSADGWTAFTVTPVAAVTAETFDLNAAASLAVTYTRAAGATAFSDACVGGTQITMQEPDEGFSTATIATPAGFNFFGFATPTITFNSNGFVSSDTTLVCASVGSSCFFGNVAMPAAGNPNGVIAPYWDDLVLLAVNGACQKTIGTKLVLQWRGTPFLSTTVVEFQAILDGANSTIEFVYGPTHALTGQSATVGIENQVGGAASFVGSNTAGLVSPAATILFTPM